MPSLDTTVFRILKAIDVSFENKNFTFSETFDLEKLNISEHRLFLHLENLINEGFINGMSIRFGISYDPFTRFHVPRLTLTGLDYLENNSSMKKAYKILKEAKEWIPGM